MVSCGNLGSGGATAGPFTVKRPWRLATHLAPVPLNTAIDRLFHFKNDAETVKTFLIPTKGLLVLALLTSLALPSLANESKNTFSAAERKRMSTFLSNFTEVKLMNFTAAEVLNPEHPEKALHFGIRHNDFNNFRTRTTTCDPKKYGSGCKAIDAKYVLESLEKYFGKNAEFVKGLRANQPDSYDGGVYHYPGADGGPAYVANVQSAENNSDGTITMRGVVYNADQQYGDGVLGPFEAVARPYTYNGKRTWAILRMSTTPNP